MASSLMRWACGCRRVCWATALPLAASTATASTACSGRSLECVRVMVVSSSAGRSAVAGRIPAEKVFVELEAQAQEEALLRVLVAIEVAVAFEAGPVVAGRQPQVLSQQATHFHAVGVLVGAMLAAEGGAEHADVPVLGDVIDDATGHQHRIEAAVDAGTV